MCPNICIIINLAYNFSIIIFPHARNHPRDYPIGRLVISESPRRLNGLYAVFELHEKSAASVGSPTDVSDARAGCLVLRPRGGPRTSYRAAIFRLCRPLASDALQMLLAGDNRWTSEIAERTLTIRHRRAPSPFRRDLGRNCRSL